MKRLLSCAASDFAAMNSRELLAAIAASEGRTLAAETIGTIMPLLGDLTNAEFAASMGADILLLNMFDVENPVIRALPECAPEETVRMIKKLTGRPVGVNLEPVNEADIGSRDLGMWAMTQGRKATVQNARRAAEMGVDMIVLTGNPGVGVTNEAIERTLRDFKRELGDALILCAGKMHASGVLKEGARGILTKDDISAFAAAGADVILLPAPGTVPGMTQELVGELIAHAHSLGCLALTAIGTSQEGADTQTIRQIALMAKMAGADIHHIGDTGYGGMALPENIMAYSVAIRGIRHTYHRMAGSVNR